MLTLIFAEASDGQMLGIGVVAGLFGTAATWLYNRWDASRDKDRAARKEEEKNVVDHQKELIRRQDESLGLQEQENESLRKEIRNLWEEMRQWEVRVVRMKAHLEYLEGIVQDAGIKFRPYAETQEGGK